MGGYAQMELAHYCPYCGLAIQRVNDKYYCSQCRVYIYIQIECQVDSPFLEVKNGS